MMLPILISVSAAPGSYFFCARAGAAARAIANSATAEIRIMARLRMGKSSFPMRYRFVGLWLLQTHHGPREVAGAEWDEVVHLLAHTDVADGYLERVGDGEHEAALCRAVELRDHHARHAKIFIELFCLGDGIL